MFQSSNFFSGTLAFFRYAGFQNHQKPVYLKEVSSSQLFLYFWSEDLPDFHGWWFGPSVGGDGVVAFCPSGSGEPPAKGWRVPFNGAVDVEFELVFENELEPTERPEGEEPKDGI